MAQRYRVSGPNRVFGREPGTTFEREIPPEQEARLLTSGAIERADAFDAPSETVDRVLAYVGEDPERAKAAGKAERSRKKGSPRSTLLEHLDAIAAIAARADEPETPDEPAGADPAPGDSDTKE